jgi:tRNA(Ile)-lysidine synthase
MLIELQKFIVKNNLFTEKNRILLALSGGIDSMVLLHMLKSLGYNISAAHCNFCLRGNESNDDEKFVKEICLKWNIKLFVKKTNTLAYAEKHRCSTQEAAREIRYTWFNKLANKNKFDFIVTAHNANDTIETFLINLIRGSGTKGLSGIPLKNNNIVRPLLFAKRIKIESYAQKNKIPYRNDSSNASLKYVRNKIRLNIIPELKKINPGFEDVVLKEIELMQQTNLFIEKYIQQEFKNLCKLEKNTLKIDIDFLKKMHSPELIIYNLLYNYSFSPTTISDIFNSLYSQPGKKFYSTTHTLIKDRKYFLLSESKNKTNKEKLITAKTKKISTPISLSFSTIPSPLKYSNNPNIALIDIKKIIFPLKVRKWKKGDYFIPLGMKGKKKLSDFFIDQKISLNKKQETYVIESGGEIVWVIGFRISEKFKLTGNSSDALKIQFENID